MTEDEYLLIGREIWTKYVPASGQSETVQGELLRAVVKLRDEAHRNGNLNWDDGHEILATFIEETLLSSNSLSRVQTAQLKADVKRVKNFRDPYLEDDLYDRLERTLLNWCIRNPDPIPRELNPELHR